MRATVLLLAVFLTRSLGVAQQISVAVCNSGALTESALRRAEAEAQAAFRSAQIKIEWSDCLDLAGRYPLIVRLRTDKPPRRAAASSLDAMGRAFLDQDGKGYIADAYIRSVREMSNFHGADASLVLGFVIAHELGHLLLGPGHARTGVMSSAWGGRELRALSQRWLRFNAEQRARMQGVLSGGVTP